MAYIGGVRMRLPSCGEARVMNSMAVGSLLKVWLSAGRVVSYRMMGKYTRQP